MKLSVFSFSLFIFASTVVATEKFVSFEGLNPHRQFNWKISKNDVSTDTMRTNSKNIFISFEGLNPHRQFRWQLEGQQETSKEKVSHKFISFEGLNPHRQFK